MRATAALSWLFLLLVTSGCGSGEMGSADAASATEPATTAEVEDEGRDSWSGVGWSMSEGTAYPPSGPPTASKVAVFQEPATASDSFASPGAEDSWEGVPEALQPGRELFAHSRWLVPASAAGGFTLFGVPTEKGWVCLHLVDPDDPDGADIGGTCSRRVTEAVEYVMSGTENRFELYGLIADDVRAVKVVVNGKFWPTVKGRNAFLFQSDPKKVCPADIESLILELGKGKTHEVNLLQTDPDEAHQEEGNFSFGCR